MAYYKEILEHENFYGHKKRLDWIKSKITREDNVLEVGCGSGSFITTPLILSKVNAYGIDIGTSSIKEAKRIACLNGISPERYRCIDVSQLSEKYDVVICSEVLEHIKDDGLPIFADALCKTVKAGGKLIITVPNGKGSFEMGQKYLQEPVAFIKGIPVIMKEAFVYYYMLIRRIWDRDDIIHKNEKNRKMNRVSNIDAGGGISMSPDNTPHVQWFSIEDILNLIMPRGFRLTEFTGSAMFSGIVPDTFLKPDKLLFYMNNKLGELFPYWASGYYFLFEKLN